MVVFFKQVEAEDKQTGATKQVPVLRYFSVFNAEQADNFLERYYPEPNGELAELPEQQAVLDTYLKDGPELRHVAGDYAHYQTGIDRITLPERVEHVDNQPAASSSPAQRRLTSELGKPRPFPAKPRWGKAGRVSNGEHNA